MTQQLATATKDNVSYPLDFGTLSADDDGYLIVTRGAYRMSYAPDIKLSDVTVSNVADDYEIPGPLAPPVGRPINRDEFLDIAMATNAAVFNTLLAKLPVVSLYLDTYKDVRGIDYADAVTMDRDTRIKRLFAVAKAANLLDDATIAAFIIQWAAMFPA